MDQAERETILVEIFRKARQQKPGRATYVCLRLIKGDGPRALQGLLERLEGPWFDYAVASVYSLLLSAERRKRLGAYFTPPHLVTHLMQRMQVAGIDLQRHSLHDPAAGGAAFIVPLVDVVAAQMLQGGASHRFVLKELRARLSGMEIDKGLASVANALVRRTLLKRHGIKCSDTFHLIKVGDTLKNFGGSFDAVVGNPPYAKVGAVGQRRWATAFPDILGGQLNLYAMFMRNGLDQISEGGLLGFIVPTSFIGGPEFSQLRIALLAKADILTLDLIEKRKGLFLDVIQDTCFVVFKKRKTAAKAVPTAPAICGQLSADGALLHLGGFLPSTDGSPWTLPSLDDAGTGGHRLADYGFRCSVGYLVANREADRIYGAPGSGRLPIIEAACVRSDGTFVHGAGKHCWVAASTGDSGVVTQATVAVQRTSNRKQKRRINAAPISQELFRKHGGVMGENHVILLIPTGMPTLSSTAMVKLLNSLPANDKYGRMCGTISLSVKLLTILDLPDPRLVGLLEKCAADEADGIVKDAYRRSSLQLEAASEEAVAARAHLSPVRRPAPIKSVSGSEWVSAHPSSVTPACVKGSR